VCVCGGGGVLSEWVWVRVSERVDACACLHARVCPPVCAT